MNQIQTVKKEEMKCLWEINKIFYRKVIVNIKIKTLQERKDLIFSLK